MNIHAVGSVPPESVRAWLCMCVCVWSCMHWSISLEILAGGDGCQWKDLLLFLIL